MIVYWLCNIYVAVMKLGKGPPGMQLLSLITIFLHLGVNSSQTNRKEVPSLNRELNDNSDLKIGETYQHEGYNRPQRWVQQVDYQPIQPHYQEQYMQTQYMRQPFMADFSPPQSHAVEAPIGVYPNQDQIYQNQYIDKFGFSQNVNTQNELQSNQFVEHSNPILNTYEENVQEKGQLFQHQDKVQQQYQQYYNDEQQRDSLLLFTGYDDYDLANTEWDIVNEQAIDHHEINTIEHLQGQNMRENQPETEQREANDLQQLKQDNYIYLSHLTSDKDKSVINSDPVRNAKMLVQEPIKQKINYETKLDKIQLLQQQLLQKQNYLMELYEDLKQDQMIDNIDQKSSIPKYLFEKKMKEKVETVPYYDQNPVMANQLEFTDNNDENSINYDYYNDEIKDLNYNVNLENDGLSNYDQYDMLNELLPEPKYNENNIPYNGYQYESGLFNEYNNNDNGYENNNVIFPNNNRRTNSHQNLKMKYIHPKSRKSKGPKYTYKYPEKSTPMKSEIELTYKFPKNTMDQLGRVNLNSKLSKNPINQRNGINSNNINSNTFQEKNDFLLENNNNQYLFDKPRDNKRHDYNNNMEISSKSKKQEVPLKRPTKVNSDDLYRYKKGRSMDLENFEDEQSKFNLENNTVNDIEKGNFVHDDNTLLDEFSSSKGSPECDESCIMETKRNKIKYNDITMDDIPKTKMRNKKAKVRKSEIFQKCDPWNPNTKTESVTSNTDIEEGTLKTTISKKSCDNKPMDDKSGQKTPCFKTITTETTVINEYCLLPKNWDKDNISEPCFRNTTITHSVTTEPCDKTEDIQKASGKISVKPALPIFNTIPPTKSNSSEENLEKSMETKKIPSNEESNSVTISPKGKVTPIININISETDNKIYGSKTNNISDCMDYRQYIKDFTNSNGCMIKSSGVSEEDINIIMELHNLLRSKVARGEEKRGGPGPQPPAANMKELRWNNDLARAAQAWAQQCPQENAPLKYRKICSRNYEIGQNVAYFGVKKDDKAQQKGKYNDEAVSKRRKKRFVVLSNSLEDSLIEEDISDAIIEDDLYAEDSLIDDDLYLEDSIIEDNLYLEDEIIDDDLYLEDAIIDDDMNLEDSIIGDDRSDEDPIINENSNEDETFTMEYLSEDEALIALDSIEDKFNEDESIEESLISNSINYSEEIVIEKVKSNEDFSNSHENNNKNMEEDFILRLHSFETDLRNQNIFNSLDKAQKKDKGWKNVIMNWYNGVDVFPNYMVSSITDLKHDQKGIDEYLRVVWAETEEIGCTVIHYADNQHDEESGNEDYYYEEEELCSIYVCNYGPAASRNKPSVYMVGDAASQCLDGVSHDYYDLCRSNSSDP